MVTFNEINFNREQCASRDWYSPGEIRFRKWEIEWLLSHLEAIKTGLWPIKGIENGAPSGRYFTDAYFVIAVVIAAEVEWRLEQCGRDGLMAKEYYTEGKSERDIGHLLNMDPFDVLNHIQKALKYMSGWKRKKRTYQEWLGHRKTNSLDRVLECLLER